MTGLAHAFVRKIGGPKGLTISMASLRESETGDRTGRKGGLRWSRSVETRSLHMLELSHQIAGEPPN